jgi:toxin-antitoxin system PIN domain toxin
VSSPPPYLLDANALIALVVADHEHHETLAQWAARLDAFALCPIVEGALVRFLVRAGESQGTAVAILTGLYDSGRCAFWSDSVSYAAVALDHVVGHRQVTDAYLAALAASRGARLATLDHALVDALPRQTELIC